MAQFLVLCHHNKIALAKRIKVVVLDGFPNVVQFILCRVAHLDCLVRLIFEAKADGDQRLTCIVARNLRSKALLIAQQLHIHAIDLDGLIGAIYGAARTAALLGTPCEDAGCGNSQCSSTGAFQENSTAHACHIRYLP